MTALLLFTAAAINVASVNVGGFHPTNLVISPTFRVDLPDTIYTMVGSDFNIYWTNVVHEANWSLITNTVKCSKGTVDTEGWHYTASAGDVGNASLTLCVNRAQPLELLYSRTVNLVTVAQDYPTTSVSRKLLIIGDSTTAPGLTSAQLVNLFAGDTKYSLTQVGPDTGYTNDASGTSRFVSMSGWNGTTCYKYWKNTNEVWYNLDGTTNVGSPFQTNGTFSFNWWLTNSGTTMSALDWVIFNLGINDIFAPTTEVQQAVMTGVSLNALTNMLCDVQSAVPGVRIGVALIIPPINDAAYFNAEYSGTQTFSRYMANRYEYVQSQISTFGAGQFGVQVIPINANIDCARNLADGVHPTAAGYWQIADTYRAFLKGME